MGNTSAALGMIDKAHELLDEADNLLKGKTPEEALTDITLVIDRSGSMATTQADAIGGMRTFVEGQQKVKGRANLTLHQFDTEHETLFEGRPIGEVKTEDIRLVPRGGTALVDAMGIAIEAATTRALRTKPDMVVIVVITDGGENSSTRYQISNVRAMIQQREKELDWWFVFIGCDPSGIKQAEMMGINSGRIMRSGAGGQCVNKVYAAINSNMAELRCVGESASMDFSEDQRSAADPQWQAPTTTTGGQQ